VHGSARSSSSSFKFQPPHAPLVRLSLSRWRGGSSVALFTVEARNLIKLNGFHGLLCNCPPPNYWRRNSCSNSSTTSFSTSHRPTDERTIYYLTNGQLALSFSDYVYLSDALSVDPRLSIALRCSVSTSLSFRLCLCLSLVSSAHVSFSLSKSIIILPLLCNPLFQPLLLSVLPAFFIFIYGSSSLCSGCLPVSPSTTVTPITYTTDSFFWLYNPLGFPSRHISSFLHTSCIMPCTCQTFIMHLRGASVSGYSRLSNPCQSSLLQLNHRCIINLSS